MLALRAMAPRRAGRRPGTEHCRAHGECRPGDCCTSSDLGSASGAWRGHCRVDPLTADRRLNERGISSIQFLLASGLGMLLFLALANLVVVQYGRGLSGPPSTKEPGPVQSAHPRRNAGRGSRES